MKFGIFYAHPLPRLWAAGAEEKLPQSKNVPGPVARIVPVTSPKKAFRSLADFRATLPKARKSSVEVIRNERDEVY